MPEDTESTAMRVATDPMIAIRNAPEYPVPFPDRITPLPLPAVPAWLVLNAIVSDDLLARIEKLRHDLAEAYNNLVPLMREALEVGNRLHYDVDGKMSDQGDWTDGWQSVHLFSGYSPTSDTLSLISQLTQGAHNEGLEDELWIEQGLLGRLLSGMNVEVAS